MTGVNKERKVLFLLATPEKIERVQQEAQKTGRTRQMLIVHHDINEGWSYEVLEITPDAITCVKSGRHVSLAISQCDKQDIVYFSNCKYDEVDRLSENITAELGEITVDSL